MTSSVERLVQVPIRAEWVTADVSNTQDKGERDKPNNTAELGSVPWTWDGPLGAAPTPTPHTATLSCVNICTYRC